MFLVWNSETKHTQHIHKTLEDAEHEAERLARANPAQMFVVLKMETAFRHPRPSPPPIIRFRPTMDDFIPF